MKKRLLIAGLLAGLSLSAVADEALDRAREEVERARAELMRATEALQEALGETEDRVHVLAPEVRVITASEPKPRIGVVMSQSSDQSGVRIAAVTPDGPAEKAGVKSGMTLVAINGIALEGEDAVAKAHDALGDVEIDRAYVLTVRDGDNGTRDITVVADLLQAAGRFEFRSFTGTEAPFGIFNEGDWTIDIENLRSNLHERIAPHVRMRTRQLGDQVNVWQFGWAWAGLELTSLNPDLGRYFGVDEGALVLEANGLEDTDLVAGDVIISVDGQPASDPRDVMRRLGRVDAGETAELEVVRDGRTINVLAKAPDRGDNFFYEWHSDDDSRD